MSIKWASDAGRLLMHYFREISRNSHSWRLAGINCMLGLSISLSWRFRLPTGLFLISSLVEDDSKSLSRSGVIDIPFAKLWQWLTLFLSRKIKKSKSKLK
ncbi:hypothetical protein EUGRSUZ_F02041 [Eucalyptus grandis]|uniref:Uncharacterized protein n=2 Tax=Eucalyptus grandis TaxID=71139 RepID=A0ACC3KGP2_EUCGR|nr:hypothetical protein EUGRSUZ_F02041 [Eucalyptus grandis]